MPIAVHDQYPARYLALTIEEFLTEFRALAAPAPDELRGEYAGYPHLGDTIESFDRIRSTALTRTSPDGYWIGKAFLPGPGGESGAGGDGGSGYNRALGVDGDVRRVHEFTTSVASSPLDGRDSLVLAYHQSPPGYDGLSLRDEVRRVSDGLYLGFAAVVDEAGRLSGGIDPFILTGPVHAWVGPDEFAVSR